jgi:DNA-binding LytR/AlgR family response regulator
MAPGTPIALVADDEPLLREDLANRLLASWPELAIVAAVGTGADARCQALARQPDVCFLDIRMPGESGLEAAQVLVDEWPVTIGHKPLPLFVFVTAFDRYALEAFEARAVDYLLKPVEPARLARCVSHLRRMSACGRPPVQRPRSSGRSSRCVACWSATPSWSSRRRCRCG